MFDLDGTLADTLADIAAAANHALEAVGCPTRPVDAYRHLAGQGVDHLIAHALGAAHLDKATRCKALYLANYDIHKYDRSGPFEGMPELLDALVENGIRLAVLSNKPHAATQDMVATLFANWTFDVVRGATDGVPLKPDPTAALAIAEQLDVPVSDWLYVGDTAADIGTGRSAGMFTVGVTWGFRDVAELRENGADAIIDQPADLLNYLD